jgi:hypothetical protein
VLEHEPTAIDTRAVFTPAPIGVDPLELAATSTLFRVEVIALVVQVDGALAAVTPDDGLMRSVDLDLKGHAVLPTRMPSRAARPFCSSTSAETSSTIPHPCAFHPMSK